MAILGAFAREVGLASRSVAVQHAMRPLRLPDYEQGYAVAWDEWKSTESA